MKFFCVFELSNVFQSFFWIYWSPKNPNNDRGGGAFLTEKTPAYFRDTTRRLFRNSRWSPFETFRCFGKWKFTNINCSRILIFLRSFWPFQFFKCNVEWTCRRPKQMFAVLSTYPYRAPLELLCTWVDAKEAGGNLNHPGIILNSMHHYSYIKMTVNRFLQRTQLF